MKATCTPLYCALLQLIPKPSHISICDDSSLSLGQPARLNSSVRCDPPSLCHTGSRRTCKCALFIPASQDGCLVPEKLKTLTHVEMHRADHQNADMLQGRMIVNSLLASTSVNADTNNAAFAQAVEPLIGAYNLAVSSGKLASYEDIAQGTLSSILSSSNTSIAAATATLMDVQFQVASS